MWRQAEVNFLLSPQAVIPRENNVQLRNYKRKFLQKKNCSQEKKYAYDVTLRWVRVTIVALESNK